MKPTFPWVSLLLACGLGLASVAQAQAFPQRPIRIVVPFAAGGSTDAMARLVGQKMAESLDQTVLVDNRPGAGGAIASDQVAKAPADGHTLLMATTSTHAILPVANPRLPYDAQKDFAPIGMVAQAPNVLIVSPTLNAHDVAGLIAWAKARPQALGFASSGNGTITHLVAEAFNKAAGIRATHVPYKTGVQALTDVSSGAIAYQFDSITWTLPQAKAGKVRALAITSAKRSPLAPELPTVAESGLPGFEGLTWFGFVAPAATPVEIQQRLTQALSLALQHPETQQKLIALGAEPASGQASELQHWMKQDAARWGQVIKEAGVKFE
jgi:tripartite-type tricarboxylate transporter receptor subunit TctC